VAGRDIRKQSVADETLRTGSLPRLCNQTAIHASSEEVVADFSFGGAPSPDGVMGFERIVFTWPAAKRLLLTLQQAVVQYERDFGSINPDPARKPAPPPTSNGNG